MRVLVCGGRDFIMSDHYASRLHDWLGRVKATEVIHGGARGADTESGKIAAGRGLSVRVFKADWEHDGKRAGPIRNQRMLDEGRPDIILAFPGGRGTEDMVRRAKAAGIKVVEVAAKEADNANG